MVGKSTCGSGDTGKTVNATIAAEIDASNTRSVHKKRGLAITPAKFGISFTATFFNQAEALVLVYRDGSVQVNHGGTEMGQGLFTKVRQIAAEKLGLPLEAVRMMPTRTDKVPNTSASAASASTDLNGAAVADACDWFVFVLRPPDRAADVCRSPPDPTHRGRQAHTRPQVLLPILN